MNSLWKKKKKKRQRLLKCFPLSLMSWQTTMYHLEINDQLCYGVSSYSRGVTWGLAVAMRHCARVMFCNSCLKDRAKGTSNSKALCCSGSPLAFCLWRRSSWRKGIDYGEQTTYSVGGNQDPVVFQLPITLLHSCYSQMIDRVMCFAFGSPLFMPNIYLYCTGKDHKNPGQICSGGRGCVMERV